MNWLSRLLQLWLAWVLTWPRLVLGVAAAVALASVVLTATRLEMLTDQLEMISANHPLIALSNRLDPFRPGGEHPFSVAIQASTPEEAVSFMARLASRVKADDVHFRDIVYRVDPEAFKSWQLLYLNKQELLNLRNKMDEHYRLLQGLANDPDVPNLLKLINQEMASRMVGELFTGFLDDSKHVGEAEVKKAPFDLSFLIVTLEGMLSDLQGSPSFKSPWSSFFKDSAWDPNLAGCFWEANKRYLLAFVVPQSRGGGFIGTQESLIQLRKMLHETEALFPGVEAGVTGQEALKNDEVSTVSADMAVATWISLLGVFMLMVAFFRSVRRPLLETIALIIGLCWTFGWVTLFIGHLNILSVVFAPILCGLGVDYGIHWLARLEEEESHGDRDIRPAIARANDRSGFGIFIAGLSAALSFLPLILTGFRGLVELGIVTGMGIVLILLATFSVLPALTTLMGGKPRVRLLPSVLPSERDLLSLKPKQARMILSGAGILCLLSVWSGSQVSFDPNPLRLQAVNAESVIWEKALIENAKRSPLFAAAFASTPSETRAKSQALERLPSVAEVETVFSLLPENQEEKIPILHSLATRIPPLSVTVVQNQANDTSALVDVLERIRFKLQEDQATRWGAERPMVEQMARVRALSQDIITALAASPGAATALLEYRQAFVEDLRDKWDLLIKGAHASIMKVEDLPEMVRGWFFQNGTYLLRIYPKESIFAEHTLARFVRDIQSVDPEVIGNPVSLYVFADAFKRACVKASMYAILAIFILLIYTFRSLKLTLLALVPLSLGSLWTVGIMEWVGIQFNLANSIFMPLVVGAGVEYGVIVLYRWKEGSMLPGHLPFSTGKGVILAALTTTLGFGALMVSHHRGIFSLGFVAWAGSLCVLLPAIIILPAIFSVMNASLQVTPEKLISDGG
jgi:uncharacterized protein